MTPDIRLEFRLKVKAGPQTIGVAFLQKSHAANEDLVHRPVSSTDDVIIGMQYGYTTRAAPRRASIITGPYNATGLGDTPSRRRDLRVPARALGRANETPCARQIISTLVRRAFAAPPTDADVESADALLSAGAEQDRRTSRPGSRWRCAASSPIRNSSSASSRRRPAVAPGDAVSHQRHRARLAAVVLPLVQRFPTMSC